MSRWATSLPSFRCLTKARMPSLYLKSASRLSRSSTRRMCRPSFRYASSRRRASRTSNLKVGSSKISRSGLKVIVVPVFLAWPTRLQVLGLLAARKRHAPDAAVAPDLDLQPLREGRDARDAHAVQPARDLVGRVVELAAGVQHRQGHLHARLLLLLVQVHRDAAPVVGRRSPSRRLWTATMMSVQYPAMASSMELSTTSLTRWWRPRWCRSPMYISGRLRTASRPLRTVIESARYPASPARRPARCPRC